MTIERTIREVEDLLEDKNFFWLLRQNDTVEGRYFANICQYAGSLPPEAYPSYGDSMVAALRNSLKKFKESDHAID